MDALDARTRNNSVTERILAPLEADKLQLNAGYCFFKRLFDICSSALALIVFSPVLLAIGLIIRIDSKGSPLFRQKRVGRNGKPFYIYKFRTMVSDAHDFEKYFSKDELEYYRRNRKLDNDPRVTSIGRFLRRTSLDELPQLFNLYGSSFAVDCKMRPGISGLWQVTNRQETQMSARADADLAYFHTFGSMTDIKILEKTIEVVVQKTGAR